MIVSVIPFLLVTNISNQWDHGPEYNFSLILDGLATNEVDNENFSSISKGTILCRPKDSNHLSCRFDSYNTTTTQFDNESKNIRYDSVDVLLRGPIVFDVIFNEKGVDHLVLPKVEVNSPNHKRFLLRNIANVMNFGIDLRNKEEEGHFEEIEEYAEGDECKVKIQTLRAVKPVRMMVDRGFNLTFVPFELKDDEIFYIYKGRSPEDCSCYVKHYYNIPLSGVINMTMQSFSGHVMVTDQHFESFYHLKATVEVLEKKQTFEIAEKMYLKLEGISPATTKWEPMKDPVKASILAIADETNE